jgi:hypothetical protein
MIALLATALLLAADAKPDQRVGVLVNMEEPNPELEKKLGSAVLDIVRMAPGKSGAGLVHSKNPLCRDECAAGLAAEKKLDLLVTVTHGDNSAGITVYDAAAKNEFSQESRATSAEIDANVATAEMLACQYLLSRPCMGEVVVSAAPGLTMQLDGQALEPGKRDLPVGLHFVSANGATRPKQVVIVRGKNPPMAVKVEQHAIVVSRQ